MLLQKPDVYPCEMSLNLFNYWMKKENAESLMQCLFVLANPVCGRQSGVQQVPHQSRPSLLVPLHLAVLYRQLQLRYGQMPDVHQYTIL